ncbi:Cilia- and flagella-associated protein 206 [Geodia barretti]|nr:Cilia- and flagella-associated protein 206 [Geodia barretti]
MHTHFSIGSASFQGGREGVLHRPVTKCDTGTQTDTHFMESNIVRSYEWNEWELRRKAIKLANLRQKVTHSVQTELSHYKRDNDTQVYLPRESACQTKRDAGTSVPRPSVYLAGLRGQGTKPTTVDLTLPVDTHNTITS